MAMSALNERLSMTHRWSIFFITSMTLFGQLAIGVFLPSMPAISQGLGAYSGQVQTSLTLYLLGFAFSQLFYGPITDRLGRKIVTITSLMIFTLGSIISLTSVVITQFMVGRLIEGIGLGGCSVIARALLRDIYSGEQLVKVTSYMGISWGLNFTLAPFIGGSLQNLFGWRANFVALLVMGIVMICVTFTKLLETQPSENVQSLRLKQVMTNYWQVLSNRQFLGFILCLFVLYGLLTAFNAMTAHIVQVYYALSPFSYGLLMVLMAGGYMFGVGLNSRAVGYVLINRLINRGFIAMLVLDSLLGLLAYNHLVPVGIMVSLVFATLLALGFVYPNCMASSLTPFAKLAGSAGALFGFIVYIGGSVGSQMSSMLPETPLALAGLFLGQILCAWGIFGIFYGNNRLGVNQE